MRLPLRPPRAYTQTDAVETRGYLHHSDWKEELDFILRFARPAEGPILDAACAGGRNAIRLAEHGFETWGLDASRHCLDLGRKEMAKISPEIQQRIHLLQEDIRAFDLSPLRFQMVICLFITFWTACYQSDEDAELALGCFMSHLTPTGIMLIDTPHIYDTGSQNMDKKSWWDAMAEKYRFRYHIERYIRGCYGAGFMLVGVKL